MQPFISLVSHAVLLSRDDIDTDQIIPARFLTTTTRTGLGRFLFADWRYDAEATPKADFPLNAPRASGARVLVAGRNFGCGSSREHAPWALADWGVRVVVASSFADIFRNNAHKNGVLTVALDEGVLMHVHTLLRAIPETSIRIDLPRQHIVFGDNAPFSFDIDPFSKRCLVDGLDELGLLLAALPDIERYEAACER